MTKIAATLLTLHALAGVFAAAPPVQDDPPVETHSVDELIAAGRAQLVAGDARAAEELFVRASAADGGSFRTEFWRLRAVMDTLDRSNQVLDDLDALAGGGREGPEMDYLFGMAFARRAQGNIAAGVTDSSIQMNFEDATAYLRSALDADAERFADAFRPLALAHWYARDLEAARTAGEEDVRRNPSHGEAHLVLGRIVLSQFAGANADEERKDEAAELWKRAEGAFERSISAFGTPTLPLRRSQVAQAHAQLGNTLLWRIGDTGVSRDERTKAADRAVAAYAGAAGWDPTAVDFGQLWNQLSRERFRAALDGASQAFTQRYGEEDAADATLLWWLGYANYQLQARPEAEAAFLRCVAKWPAYVNSWLYVSLCRYDTKDYDGALDALRTGWEAAPESMVAAIEGERARAIPILEYLVGHCVAADRLLDAAFVSEVCAESARTEPRYWNNLGLFLRDEGDRLKRSRQKPSASVLTDLWTRSLAAYQRALDLSPDDPAFLNDTAVILHYYLETELDAARSMYVRARERAEELLTGGELTSAQKDLYKIALRDSKNNLRALDKLIEKRAREAAAKKKEKEDDPLPPIEGEG